MTGTQESENANPNSWIELSLHGGGRSLIEASAGTGKTWTISVLYLRLLLEQGLDPTRIVVTTFTDAAAQELRERIRSRLAWAQQQAEAALAVNLESSGDDDAQWLHERWRGGGDGGFDPAAANADLGRLRLASAELDLAPIGTLHSLCRRILADYPFESGSTFGLGEMVSSETLLAELIDDLWRRLGQSDGDPPIEDRVWWQAGRSALSAHLRRAMAPGVGVQQQSMVAIDELMRPRNAEILRDWLGDGSQFTRSNSRLFSRLKDLACFIETADPTGSAPDDLAAILDEPLEKHIKAHAIAAAAGSEALAFARQAASILPSICDALRSRGLSRYREELRTRGQQRLAASGQVTFDELIERVHRALPEGGSALAERLFEAWPVALVDEFQDTDALQYGILDRIYRDRSGAHRGRLVMIGDPKQAIYRFRGGDIDTYLEARASATSTLTLDTNFRSSRQLVDAVNAFHARAGGRLSSLDDHPICYEPVKAGGRRDRKPYCVDGVVCDKPLQFHYWDAHDVPDAAGDRSALALAACANQIVELLACGRHTIGGEPVQPGDIAVLLPNNAQIGALRELLRERKVPCVSSAKSSVFDSDWARELQIVLHAALHPRDDAALRAALATRIGGKTYDALRQLRDRPEDWQREARWVAQLDRLWQSRGVLAVVQQLIRDAHARLFAGGDGERVLTDLRHLGEQLQAQSEKLTGREQLLAWLADQRSDDGAEAGDAADEMRLRIESDAARVQLMTLHSSKGLEFPIVLLPLMWANKHNSLDTINVLHDPASRRRMVAFGSEARRRFRQEGQDERFRLLYVALTRARYACHVHALSPERPLHKGKTVADIDPNRAPLDTMIERLLATGQAPDTIEHVRWSTGAWSRTQAKYESPAAPVIAESVVLSEPAPPSFESRYSFSALAHGGTLTAIEESPASDESEGGPAGILDPATTSLAQIEPAAPEPEHSRLKWLAPVAGAAFGNAVHAIFEHRAIGRPMADQFALVQRCLRDEGVRLRDMPLAELVPHLAARVQVTLDTLLLPDSEPGLTLGTLPAHALRAEMEFDFVLGEVSLRRLREVCDFVPGSSMHTLRGLMNGKIDLVFEHNGRFHVLDYKSNRLGDGAHLSDYAPARLQQAMDHSHYRFQALLYTVAVDRYLRQRIADYERGRHLGEAIYLFVRATGIAPESEPRAGIWTQRFDDRLINAVDAVFATEAREAA